MAGAARDAAGACAVPNICRKYMPQVYARIYAQIYLEDALSGGHLRPRTQAHQRQPPERTTLATLRTGVDVEYGGKI